MKHTVDARSALRVNDRDYRIWSLESLGKERVGRLPYSLRILLENLLRHEDGVNVTRRDIESYRHGLVILRDCSTPVCQVDVKN